PSRQRPAPQGRAGQPCVMLPAVRITTHTHPRPYCRAHTTSAGRTARSLLSTSRRTPGLASGR
ncbi:MAG TPA: hypothetical protein VGE05_00700, partial [Novosphingobium sp.]